MFFFRETSNIKFTYRVKKKENKEINSIKRTETNKKKKGNQ
jgi:hypothetical protein